MRSGRSWLSETPALLILLGLAGAAEAVTLDRDGQYSIACPGLQVTEAKKSGDDRSYVFEGACQVPGPSLVSVTVKAVFDKSDGTANEKVSFAGPGESGEIAASRRGCASDPFVVGGGPCTGQGFFSVTGSAAILEATSLPLMAGRVPANQAYQTVLLVPASPPPGAGQVRITKPVDKQSFVFGDHLAVEVRFAAANFAHPPAGGVGIQWGRETSIGTCTFDLGYLGVAHYSMTQFLGKSAFPSPGRYCLRATSKPGQGSVSTWTDWSPAVRIAIGERVAATSPGSGFGGAAATGDKTKQENAGAAIARLPTEVMDDATRQLKTLEGRLMRLGTNAEAAKLLRDIRAYRGGLDPETSEAALKARLRELTARVEGLEAAAKKLQPVAPKASVGPSAKPKAVTP